MANHTDGSPVKSLEERRIQLIILESQLEVVADAYLAAQKIACETQCDGIVRRLQIHLDKLSVLQGKVKTTYARLQRREIANGN